MRREERKQQAGRQKARKQEEKREEEGQRRKERSGKENLSTVSRVNESTHAYVDCSRLAVTGNPLEGLMDIPPWLAKVRFSRKEAKKGKILSFSCYKLAPFKNMTSKLKTYHENPNGRFSNIICNKIRYKCSGLTNIQYLVFFTDSQCLTIFCKHLLHSDCKNK